MRLGFSYRTTGLSETRHDLRIRARVFPPFRRQFHKFALEHLCQTVKFVAPMYGIVESLGRWVSWLALAMAVSTCVVVVLRYGFRIGSIPLQESVTYMHACMILVGLSYTMKHDAHVRIDLIYSRLSPSQKQVVNLLGHCLFLVPVCITILVITTPYTANSWRVLEHSVEVSGLPGIFLLKTFVPISAGLLLIQALAEVAQLIQALRSAGNG